MEFHENKIRKMLATLAGGRTVNHASIINRSKLASGWLFYSRGRYNRNRCTVPVPVAGAMVGVKNITQFERTTITATSWRCCKTKFEKIN